MQRLAFTCAAVLAVGCVTPPHSNLCGGEPCPSESSVENVFQRSENRMLDILFVVDDTPAIALYQQTLLDGFASNAGALEGFPGGLPDLHVGFVPASPCASAPEPGACGLQASASFLTVQSCGQQRNFTGSLDAGFSCLGNLGVSSCGPAQPLAALRGVLERPPPGWQGFLRPDAYLAIVFVVAGDDASPGAISDAVDFLRGLKTDASNQIVVTTIAGPPSGDCAGFDLVSALPRLSDLTRSFGSNGIVDSLCVDGLKYALVGLNTNVASLIAPMCLPGVRDIDPTTPGIQAACAVEETVTRTDGSSTTTVMPSCDEAGPPCWRVSHDAIFATICPTSFVVERAAGYCPDWFTRTHVECLGCLDPADPACAPP